MKENMKRELLEQASQKQFSIMKTLVTKSSPGYYIPPKLIQYTKRYKIKHNYIGRKWEKHKKLKKLNVADIFRNPYKISQIS